METKKSNIENPKEKTLVDLANGKEPETEDEKELKKDLEDIKRKGRVVEIPSDI